MQKSSALLVRAPRRHGRGRVFQFWRLAFFLLSYTSLPTPALELSLILTFDYHIQTYCTRNHDEQQHRPDYHQEKDQHLLRYVLIPHTLTRSQTNG